MKAEANGKSSNNGSSSNGPAGAKLSAAQRKWLARGLAQPGGKLPLFDEDGQRVNRQVIDKCLREGWAEPWFDNPIKPDWRICKLTDAGRAVLGD